jgi:hypothetical protein
MQLPQPNTPSASGETPLQILERHGLLLARCFGSKSGYRTMNPDCQFIPNANVFSAEGKLWWGDLDLALDRPALEAAALELGERLYVLCESDGRFGAEERPIAKILADALWHTGGNRRVALKRIVARSGLTREQFVEVSGVLPSLFSEPVAPEIALQWERRLTAFRNVSHCCSKALGLPHWGDWWLHPVAPGKPAPIELLRQAKAEGSNLTIPIPPQAKLTIFDDLRMWVPVQEKFPW